MMKTTLSVAIALVLAGTIASARATDVSGTLVNIATYVSGDQEATTFNMGAMMGNGYGMTGGGMMNGYSGHGGMYGCRSALGLVTSSGDLYLLITDAQSSNVFSLCNEVGSHVTIQGTVFSKAGVRAIRVEGIRS